MSYESKAEPIKIGYLMDFLLSDDFPQHYRDDLTIPFDMVFDDALRQGHHRSARRDRLPRGRRVFRRER